VSSVEEGTFLGLLENFFLGCVCRIRIGFLSFCFLLIRVRYFFWLNLLLLNRWNLLRFPWLLRFCRFLSCPHRFLDLRYLGLEIEGRLLIRSGFPPLQDHQLEVIFVFGAALEVYEPQVAVLELTDEIPNERSVLNFLAATDEHNWVHIFELD